MTPQRTGIGARGWAVPGGRVPLPSTGPEPQFTRSDQLFVLNPTTSRPK
ncbi:sensory rhodopsin transducer [Micromonospora sp. NPDC050795]